MARRQDKEQQETVARVMHEFKQGELETGQGRTVRNPKQAIAIALSEAGASNRQSPAEQRRTRRRTAAREAEAAGSGDGRTRQELYEEAKRRGIPGRSKMSKAQLESALHS